MKQRTRDKDLRRQVEILRAQISSSKDVYIPKVEQSTQKKSPHSPTASVIERIDTSYIKKDLLKTILLSLLAFSIILTVKLI